MNNEFKVVLETVLDKSGVNTGLKEVQDLLNKYALEITPDLKTISLKNEIKAVSDEFSKVFNEKFNLNVTGWDISKAINSQISQINKLKDKAKNIEVKVRTGEHDLNLSKLQSDVEKLGNEAKRLKIIQSGDNAIVSEEKKNQGNNRN